MGPSRLRHTPAPVLTILHLDNRLVAVHKPAGLLVHRSNLDRHETRFALQLVRDRLGREVHPVHRLDRPTSGVLLFALDRDGCRRMSAAFEAGQVDKQYLAIVRGHPADTFEIDHPLVRLDDDATACGGTQPALTRGCTLARAELPHRVDRYPTSRYAMVSLAPVTGRRHQLRRHLKHAAHPIVGDTTYGKSGHNRLFESLFGNRRLLLACTSLAFEHPETGRPLRITAPPDDDFSAVIASLGWTPPGPR